MISGYPSTIQIKISEDGKTYKPVYQVDLDSQDQDFQILKKEFTCPVNQKTRYLEVQVESIGNCPEWHPGRNEQGWLFIDEIIIN